MAGMIVGLGAGIGIAAAVNMIVMVAVSLMTEPPPEDLQQLVKEVRYPGAPSARAAEALSQCSGHVAVAREKTVAGPGTPEAEVQPLPAVGRSRFRPAPGPFDDLDCHPLGRRNQRDPSHDGFKTPRRHFSGMAIHSSDRDL